MKCMPTLLHRLWTLDRSPRDRSGYFTSTRPLVGNKIPSFKEAATKVRTVRKEKAFTSKMEMKIIFAIALSYLAIVNATPVESVENDLEDVTGATVHLITTLAENKTTATAHVITVTAANTTATAHVITVTAANTTATAHVITVTAANTTEKTTQHHNITVVPITNTAGTVDTSMVTITNAGTIDTTMLTHSKTAITRNSTTVRSTSVTTTPASTTKAPSRSFDGASFAGGIALGLGLCIIVLIGYKCYTSRTSSDYNKM
ncbi:hypothetical protein CHS0354_005969 [Potamilus streckersoni]|uniref:Porimin n=1 Tax=Potamilus streckersoni TaxID=2493646 RepID=A0AAE0VHE6_9BIVA|nr:hypothetical protein CHS0354_005969 [Potamilus streckersoni]